MVTHLHDRNITCLLSDQIPRTGASHRYLNEFGFASGAQAATRGRSRQWRARTARVHPWGASARDATGEAGSDSKRIFRMRGPVPDRGVRALAVFAGGLALQNQQPTAVALAAEHAVVLIVALPAAELLLHLAQGVQGAV